MVISLSPRLFIGDTNGLGMRLHVLRPPSFFVRFAFSTIHGSPFFTALPLPCIILNANRRTKKKMGEGWE